MAYAKKTPKSSAAYQKLRNDIKAGTPGSAYIFYGEESYLRQRALEDLQKTLIPPGAETFNFHKLEGQGLTADALTETAEAMPMMAERTLLVVTDYDLFKLNQDVQEKITAFLEDVPSYCCVVFVYDTIAYKPVKTTKAQKALAKAVEAHVEAVEFLPAQGNRLTEWIAAHFAALGKSIDGPTAEYLVFVCGGLMTGLAPEIDKIASYTKGNVVTKKDIDAIADPVLSAEVFRLSDAVVQGKYDRAAAILADLLKMQTEPIMIVAALGSQLRRIWTARLALDSGRGRSWALDLWGMKPGYVSNMIFSAAQRTSAEWCANAVKRCQVLDRRFKSQRGADPAGELKLLLAELGAGKR
ncbi:MAG: DNA polymerase III subunit delta [Oscillibacter sp.]|jgi:DNA polymerase-3 subunit delta|nr:DNA polymerase III subunit delta [Oscillibacter sp.]